MSVGRFVRFVLLVIIVGFGLSELRSYRVRAAAEEARQFAPATIAPVILPAGTPIQAVLWDTIAESAAPGDRVTASVSTPVMVKGKVWIPSGAQLKGALKEVSVFRTKAELRIDFTLLMINRHELPIKIQEVVAIAPVHNDLEILASGFRTLMGAMLGAALGAGSEDLRVIPVGIVAGAAPSREGNPGIPIRVVLARDLEIFSRFRLAVSQKTVEDR